MYDVYEHSKYSVQSVVVSEINKTRVRHDIYYGQL